MRKQVRDVAVTAYASAYHNDLMDITVRPLLEEMVTFVLQADGKEEHLPGCNDDLLMSGVMAIFGERYIGDLSAKASQALARGKWREGSRLGGGGGPRVTSTATGGYWGPRVIVDPTWDKYASNGYKTPIDESLLAKARLFF